ncbi:MAG TPA: GNAT family N-acetyltransferase [Candidatus Avidehalobacter gallistercoris]|uniref:GNAT family N-acetyltransferase n=1 Tax=Candidatus Avidehalobacter gallistercoris TaxID=2840694 RepID=A0A9D1HIV6_9FIRM|nr:GNAT family N-acetyltransferase [Candidatus Avidehalobacter gallistercoris]
MYLLELAKLKDIAKCYAIIKAAKEFQREQGFIQWTDDYPNETTVLNDVQNEKGYVIIADSEIAGYMCIDFSGEPAYENIEGKWNTELPYAVIHRMALSEKYRGKGLSSIAFTLVEDLCISKDVKNIRVDTDFQNRRMQHILDKAGFAKCGVVIFQGSGKLAYDKKLSKIAKPAGLANSQDR